MRNELLELGPSDTAGIDDAARLHMRLLPTSPIARLGPGFMRRFYYRSLVADRLITCVLAYVNDEPAGFIVCTAQPSRFMGAGVRRHYVRLPVVVAGAVLADPRRLAVIWWVSRFMRRPGAPVPAGEGEILSFGVLPEFRNPGFVRRTGRRISSDLFDRARAYFQREGLMRFRAVVESGNREALMFYLGRGARHAGSGSAAGTTVVICEEADDPPK